MFGEMFGQPPHGATHLRNDAVEPSRWRQRVFDDREIDPERKQALGEEGETLLYDIVYLPITAVDERKRRRVRIGGEKQIEPLARRVAIGKIKMAGSFAPHSGAACGPIGDNRVALGDRRGVVVGGIELGTVHSAVQHGADSGRYSVGQSGQSATRSAAAGRDARWHKGDQRRLIATAPVVTRYFASRLALSRAGIDTGSATHARKRRVKAPKAASWPTRIASGIAIRHSDPRASTAIPG